MAADTVYLFGGQFTDPFVRLPPSEAAVRERAYAIYVARRDRGDPNASDSDQNWFWAEATFDADVSKHYPASQVVTEARTLGGLPYANRVALYQAAFPSLELSMCKILADLHLCKLCGAVVAELSGNGGIQKSHFIPKSLLDFFKLEAAFLASDFTGARNYVSGTDFGAWTYKGFCFACEQKMSRSLEDPVIKLLKNNNNFPQKKLREFVVLVLWRSLLAHATLDHFDAEHRPFWLEARSRMSTFLYTILFNPTSTYDSWLDDNLHLHAYLDDCSAAPQFLAEPTLRSKSATINTLALIPLISGRQLCEEFTSLEVQCGVLHLIAARFTADYQLHGKMICGHCATKMPVIVNASVQPLSVRPLPNFFKAVAARKLAPFLFRLLEWLKSARVRDHLVNYHKSYGQPFDASTFMTPFAGFSNWEVLLLIQMRRIIAIHCSNMSSLRATPSELDEFAPEPKTAIVRQQLKSFGYSDAVINQGELLNYAVGGSRCSLAYFLHHPESIPWLSVAMTHGILKAAVSDWIKDLNVAHELGFS